MLQQDERVKEIRELYRRWSDARKDWESNAREDIDFYLGNHFSSAEISELESRNQSSVAFDRLYSAIEQFKAIITSKPPKFSAVGRENSDTKMANVWKTILEYIWDISDGDEEFKQAVHDYTVTGLGYLYCFIDKEADYGRGEVKFSHINPFRVYVDPNARHKYFDDATGIMVSTIFTKFQLIDLYPQLNEPAEEGGKPMIDSIEGMDDDEDYPSSTNSSTQGSFTPDKIKNADTGEGTEKYRLIEYYSKTKIPYYRVVDMQSGSEQIMSSDKFAQLAENPQMQQAMEAGLIDVAEVLQTRIKLTCSLGQIVLYERILETDIYPIVPMPNIWTNTPYPMSDVRKNKDFQRFLNKCVSLITSHAQASAGLKLLIPQGSVHDIEELERDWANPNATIEYDASFGEPHFPAVTPLPNSIMELPKLVEGYIDLNMGIFEMMHGQSDAAPKTYAATMMMEDLGQRRSKSKLRDIEGSIKRVGRCAYNLAQQHYKHQKTFRIVQPNNDISEATVNMRIYDDKTQELASIENDIGVGQFDVRVIGSSTLPSNKWGEWQIYMEAYQAGIIDRTEALKKSEIFDKAGVMERTDEMLKMQGMIQQLQGQLKQVSGDKQTTDRENLHLKQRVEVEKFKTKLKESESDTKASNKLALGQLTNAVKLESERLRLDSNAKMKAGKEEKSQKGA
jgi:hypothetical protein